MSIAGFEAFAVAMFVGRRLVTASHALSSAVQDERRNRPENGHGMVCPSRRFGLDAALRAPIR
jgi:hypothetical protein